MSGFLGNAGIQASPVLERTIQNHCDEYFFDNEDAFQGATLYSIDWNSVIEAAGFVSPWWPFRGGLLGVDSGDLLSLSARHSDMWRSFGSSGRLSLVGTTRDALGSPLGNCTVRLFRTSTDELVTKITSNANGAFVATSPYDDAHYMTVHGPGGVAGATIDTLIPG